MASFNNHAGVKGSMHSASRLSPLQRAYLIGFHRARILARSDVNALAYLFGAASDVTCADLRGVRREMARLRAIDHGLEAERDDSDQGSRPVGSSTDLKSAALIARSTPSLISRVTGKLQTWRRRERERAELARMSQAELHDIGVSSADHWAEISKPFWRK
jgi:uncharacterized protein YjiS (DUF1127 family)